jgi:hypothetical protein
MAVLITGCVGPIGPVLATSNSGASKVGCHLQGRHLCRHRRFQHQGRGANGGITKISHVDYHVTSVLGLYCETTVTVYGK